jgi:hydroxymethylglutaryl-CoA lyase
MTLKLIECPRDAMQGLHHFIPTQTKIEYLNGLLSVGFDTIDFGSFVSSKAIPQLRDTEEVLKHLKLSETNSKLLAIVANTRGAEDASKFNEIDYLGFPFSVSETFQLRNTNSTIEQSLTRVEEIQNICHKTNKKLVVYLSMGFGNPYGDKKPCGLMLQKNPKHSIRRQQFMPSSEKLCAYQSERSKKKTTNCALFRSTDSMSRRFCLNSHIGQTSFSTNRAF